MSPQMEMLLLLFFPPDKVVCSINSSIRSTLLKCFSVCTSNTVLTSTFQATPLCPSIMLVPERKSVSKLAGCEMHVHMKRPKVNLDRKA